MLKVRDDVHRSEDKLHCTQGEYFFFSNGNTNFRLFCVDFLDPEKREDEGIFT